MSEIISNLNLTDEVGDALLTRSGPLGNLLILAEKLEITDFDAVVPLLEICDVTLDQLLTAQLEAFNWRANVIAH